MLWFLYFVEKCQLRFFFYISQMYFVFFFFFLEQVTLICGEVRASFIFLFYISQLYFCFVGYFFFSAAVMVVCSFMIMVHMHFNLLYWKDIAWNIYCKLLTYFIYKKNEKSSVCSCQATVIGMRVDPFRIRVSPPS